MIAKLKAVVLAALFAFSAAAGAQFTSNTGYFASKTNSVVIGSTGLEGGATTQVLYNLAGVVSSSANLTYSEASGPRLKVGSTANGTSTGLILGYWGATGSGALWNSSLTVGVQNYAIKQDENGKTQLNSATGQAVVISVNNGADSFYTFGPSAGQGLYLNDLGTATTDVSALRATQTWNAAGVAFTGWKFTITDTASAAGSLAMQILCGSAATTNCLSVPKEGGIAVKAKVMSGTAPAYASGGCLTGAGTVVTNENGTAHFTVTNGTGCAASQPIVLTLPAATTGWNCYARNVSNAATSAPAQTGAVSTTSVTITNFNRTTGIAAAWTDSDVVVISCLGG